MNNPQQTIQELTVWTSTKCNLKCKYCFVYKLNEAQSHKTMTTKTADQLIKFAAKHLSPTGRIWFFGAEPLCNFEIIKYIVHKSRSEGYKWQFGATTNATLIDEEKVQWMKQANFGLLLSIDGLKDGHDANRVYADGKGSWDDAWRGLTLVREVLNPTPQIRWTVTPSTLKGLATNIKTLVEKYGLTNMAVDFTYEVEWTQTDLATLKEELEVFGRYYHKWMLEGKPVFSMFMRDANAAITQTVRPWCNRCGLGNGGIGVDYDGTLYPCHRFIDSHKIQIGDIYNGFNAMHKQWIEDWRKIVPYCEEPKKCLNCNYKMACSGGCIAMNYDLFGTPHINVESLCTIKQLIVDTLGELCRSLQTNPTFQKQYQKTAAASPPPSPNFSVSPHRPCGCSDKTHQQIVEIQK
ncbi:radical SAM protein [Candidatus Bathycorpusculum sp.]|uniref:radical SAM/SPASM domain-containing protein n=1 Tax=Candidatus Bathycorpusculum sp. TaxID=2994959 RepID=UPI00281FB594|nr:SPASM domain-containing protein [Candidatus Termitimicrobium sp.]MCL2685675.1 SPASM domain-containing protein [Candidatus Termitimicrobium sp.]